MNVQIVLFDGFDLLDIIAPFEVFEAAAMFSKKDIDLQLVSAEGERTVLSGSNQITLQASSKLDLTRKGLILIPGASGTMDEIPARLKKAADTDLSSLLKKALMTPDILITTVCGGSLILSMNGLLEGRHAVTHPMGMDLLTATNTIAVKARVVDDGDLVTGGGVTSGLDVALYLVERELGPQIALAVEQLFEYERRGTVWKKEGEKLKESKQVESEKVIDTTIQLNEIERFIGKWDTTIATPVGNQSVLFNLYMKEGQLAGKATQGGDSIILDNLVLDGSQLRWSMKVTKPMRLTLKCTVSVNGHEMHGEAKAGMLPSSKLAGHRL